MININFKIKTSSTKLHQNTNHESFLQEDENKSLGMQKYSLS